MRKNNYLNNNFENGHLPLLPGTKLGTKLLKAFRFQLEILYKTVNVSVYSLISWIVI